MSSAVDLRTLLFDDPAGAAGVISAAVLGEPGGKVGDVVRGLPEAAQKGALNRVTEAATGLLEKDVTEVFCAGWQKHTEIQAAARASLAEPDAPREAGLATHSLALHHEPSVELRLSGTTLATLTLQVQLDVLVRSLKAIIKAGRLVGVAAGTCDIDGSLAVNGMNVAQRQISLPLSLAVQLKGDGWRLVDGN
jgi:hypothetical protein